MATVSESQVQDPLPSNPSSANPNLEQKELSKEVFQQLMLDLQDPKTRANALSILVKEKGNIKGLAEKLWFSFETVSILLEEVTGAYKALPSLELMSQIHLRVSNAIHLFQVIACDKTTAKLLVRANIPIYLYAFLDVKNSEDPYEYLRLTSLAVIGALLKTGEPGENILYLLGSQIVPCCLRCMEIGCPNSKIVATLILQKLMSIPKGRKYFCDHFDRSSTICLKLKSMLDEYGETEIPPRLLKYAADCYMKLSDCPRLAHLIWSFYGSLVPRKFEDRNLLSSYLNSLDLVKQQAARTLMVLFKKLNTEGQMQNSPCGH